MRKTPNESAVKETDSAQNQRGQVVCENVENKPKDKSANSKNMAQPQPIELVTLNNPTDQRGGSIEFF